MINRDTISMIVKKIPKPAQNVPSGFLKKDFSDSLKEGYRVTSHEIEELVRRLEKEGKTLAVWGASHQGFTLAATTVLGQRAEYMIDSAPFKQGKFAPASHLPIVAPEHFWEHPADVVLIAAPGYTDEIAGIIREKSNAKVEILAIRTSHIENV